MARNNYDIICVGGGIGGSTVARIMADAGRRVLVLEKVTAFKDRVRGEVTTPWGTVEAKKLGVYDLLQDTSGHALPWLDIHINGIPVVHRDMLSTTPESTPFYALSHPSMQEVLLKAAEDSGAEVRRGLRVTNVTPGAPALVNAACGKDKETFHARLVVGADGRASAARKWGGFKVEHDQDRLLVCGVLFDTMNVPTDTANFRMNTEAGLMTFWFPQRNGNVRSYVVYQADAGYRISGKKDVPRFIEESIKAGARAEEYTGAKAIGPLATFNGADNWVAQPFKEGLALIGDAAASSDAAWGEGLPLALLDARMLTEQLMNDDDWNAAGHRYADAHDKNYDAVH
ncbi:MAG: 2-polyprenyl-6-methoxyphenol hydroxylase-like FAD-dependent oxidoreductase, partial [Gammaproteobacteria bacterium]